MAMGDFRPSYAKSNVVALIAICVSLFFLLKSQASQRVRVDTAMLHRMIDALANRNQKPEFVDVGTRLDARHSPLFPEDYDWAEDRRVAYAIRDLQRFDGEELWQCLCEHLEDERYLKSYAFNDAAHVSTIGYLAFIKTNAELSAAYLRHFPMSWTNALWFPQSRVIHNLYEAIAWHREHKNVPLYQQQIEACQISLQRMRSIKSSRPPTQSEVEKFEQDVSRQIEVLRLTKTPVLRGQWLMSADNDYYDKELVERIRKEYRAKKAE